MQEGKPSLFGIMPGALMYRVPPTNGIPVTETDTTRQVRGLMSAPAFSVVPEVERDALIESIAQTTCRAEYHYQRFRSLRSALDDVRAWAPGDVFWDAAGSYIHYELQSLAGAARVLVDEMLHLTARRYGQHDWRAAPIIKAAPPAGSAQDVPEVHRLRTHAAWFALLNAYRNTFFHAGWKHGSGHFDSDGRQASQSPKMNALLVPDQKSLARGSRPHQWTYHEKVTVDDVANRIREGMFTVVGELCEKEWGVGVPPPGTIRDHERPNLFVSLPCPITFTIGDGMFAPIFSTRERAEAMAAGVPDLSAQAAAGEVELVEVRSSSDVVGVEAISLSFAGLSPAAQVKSLQVCLDPEPADDEWRRLNVSSVAECRLDELLADKFQIVSVPVHSPMTAYVWRTPFLMT